jgi:hypothetical protein
MVRKTKKVKRKNQKSKFLSEWEIFGGVILGLVLITFLIAKWIVIGAEMVIAN